MIHIIVEAVFKEQMRTWRDRTDIPNTPGFELVVKLRSGLQAATKVVMNGRTGCHALKGIRDFSQVTGWRNIEASDREALKAVGVVRL